MGHKAEVTRGEVWGTVGERGPAPVPPDPEAHQALPRSDISRTWGLIQRRSSLGGKEGGRGRYEAFQGWRSPLPPFPTVDMNASWVTGVHATKPAFGRIQEGGTVNSWPALATQQNHVSKPRAGAGK